MHSRGSSVIVKVMCYSKISHLSLSLQSNCLSLDEFCSDQLVSSCDYVVVLCFDPVKLVVDFLQLASLEIYLTKYQYKLKVIFTNLHI